MDQEIHIHEDLKYIGRKSGKPRHGSDGSDEEMPKCIYDAHRRAFGLLPVAVALMFLVLAISGCTTPDRQLGDESVELSRPEMLGWKRNGSFEIPTLRIGDVYWIEYDVEWHGSATEEVAVRVREAPGPMLDRKGTWFDPPAVLEDWQPINGMHRYWVLGNDGTIVATLHASDADGEGDALFRAWSSGAVTYGPYGLVQGLHRALLLLGLTGTKVDGQDLKERTAYLTDFELYVWQETEGGRIGTIGSHYHGGALGGLDRDPVEEYVEYAFDGAPIPVEVHGKHRVSGGKLDGDDPDLVARLTDWRRGEGEAIYFSGTPEKFSLPDGRFAYGSPLPMDGIPVNVTQAEALTVLRESTDFMEWQDAHRGARMTRSAFSLHSNGDDQDRLHGVWNLRHKAGDGASLSAAVANHTYERKKQNHTLVDQITGRESTETYTRLEVEWVNTRDGNGQGAFNSSLVPNLIHPVRAYEIASRWAPPDANVSEFRVGIGDRNHQYIWPHEWDREIWYGTGDASFCFEADANQAGPRWTHVSFDLATGWVSWVRHSNDNWWSAC